MAKKSVRQILKFSHQLYQPTQLVLAVDEFSQFGRLKLTQTKKQSDVSFEENSPENLPFEFANYALFLTIQAK